MQHQRGHFQGLKNLDIFYQGWLPEGPPRAILLVVHGLAEHGGRYGNLADYFVPRGYALYALDHRGHGHSEGRRVYVERFDHYLEDLQTFFDRLRERHPELQIFMLGHSMGGTIALAYALRHPDGPDGLILSGPGVRAGASISPLLIGVNRLISRLWPTMGLVRLEAAAISRDPAVVAAYENDPLVYRGKITARLGAKLMTTTQDLQRRAPELRLPTLILHGGEDRLVDPAGSRWLYRALGSTDKELEIYDGLYHEVFNEPEQERVLADVETWLDDHTRS